MPQKSPQYYKNTVILKISAHGSWLLDQLGLLEKMKEATKSQVKRWQSEGNTEGYYKEGYFAYSFIQQPRELEKLMVFDDSGIPIGWEHARPTAHNPLMVSYYALVCWNNYVKTADEESKEKFIASLDFLIKTGKHENGCYWLPYHQSVPNFGLVAPWHSGLAHAVAMSAFIRAFDLTSNESYRNIAQHLCNSLVMPEAAGGFFEQLPDGGTWIQEYPTEKIKQVLNGLLFCLIGLYEFQLKMGDNPEIAKVLSACEETLFKRLPQYLVGPYTRYSYDRAAFSNIEYQGLFVFLFLHLYHLSGKFAYLKLAERFNGYTNWEGFFSFYHIFDYKGRLPLKTKLP